MCCPSVQFDDQLPPPIPDVAVAAVAASAFGLVAQAGWQAVRLLDVSDVTALQRRGDPLAGFMHQVQEESPPAQAGSRSRRCLKSAGCGASVLASPQYNVDDPPISRCVVDETENGVLDRGLRRRGGWVPLGLQLPRLANHYARPRARPLAGWNGNGHSGRQIIVQSQHPLGCLMARDRVLVGVQHRGPDPREIWHRPGEGRTDAGVHATPAAPGDLGTHQCRY